MKFNDLLKTKINELQYRIDRNSNIQLLIFDNQNLLNRYLKTLDKEIVLNERSITLYELCYSNKLDGLRFRNYCFIGEQDIKELLDKEGEIK